MKLSLSTCFECEHHISGKENHKTQMNFLKKIHHEGEKKQAIKRNECAYPVIMRWNVLYIANNYTKTTHTHQTLPATISHLFEKHKSEHANQTR